MSRELTSLPIPNGTYKIQSAKSDLFFEISHPNDDSDSGILVRQSNESNDQKWDFFAIGYDKYKITNKSAPAVYLSLVGSPEQKSQLVSSKKEVTWVVKKSNKGSSFILAPPDTILAADLNSANEVWLWDYYSDNENQMWKIITVSEPNPEVSDPGRRRLLDGTYRVRNLNPAAVLEIATATATGDANVYVSEQKDAVSQQWELKRLASGKLHLMNAGRYLAYPTDAVETSAVKGQAIPCEWELRDVGGFACSFAVPGKNLVIGFRDFRADIGDQPVLMESIGAHSQIWILEKWKSLIADSKEFVAGQITKDVKIQDGRYQMLNMGSGQNIILTPSVGPWRVENKSDYVEIIMDEGENKGKLNTMGSVNRWTLASQNGVEGYYVCEYPNAAPLKVMAWYPGMALYVTEDLKLNEPYQKLNFVPA